MNTGSLIDLLMSMLRTLSCIFLPRPLYGLIFLYKWRPGEKVQGTIVQDSRLQEIFFAKQVSKDDKGGKWNNIFFFSFC